MAIVFDDITKIIEIESPETEITIQELINAVRDWEDELVNIDIQKVASAAGKEDLGGGVSVGITMTLLNGWKIKFGDRSGPAYVPCRISGGNLVSDDASIPYVGSAYVTIGLSASSAATSADSEAIQYSSYGGGISVDIINGDPGTDYPLGNQEYPVDNLTDAVSIANAKGFKTIFIRESMTIDSGTVLSNFRLVGRSHVSTLLTMDTSAICDGVTVENANVTGVLDGDTHITRCSVGSINYVNGQIHDSGLYGTIILGGGKDAVIANCFTINQDDPTIIDMGGTGQDLAMPNYSGLVTVQNFSDVTGEIGIGLDSGKIVLESTITAGAIILSGSGLIEDNSTGTATVNIDGLINRELITKTTWDTVWIDTAGGASGTSFPLGTEKYPVDNLTDALTISARESIERLRINGAMTITTGQDISGYTLMAERSLGNSVIVNSGAITLETYFENLTVSGTMNGSVRYTTCVMGAINNFDGGAKNCLLTGDIAITGTGSNYFTDCDVYVTDVTAHRGISLGAYTLNVIRCRGNYKLTDKTSTNATAIDLVAGVVVIDSTCTAGTVGVSGIAEVIDNSGAGCTVIINSISHTAISESVWDEDLTEHNIIQTAGAVQQAIRYDNFVTIDSVNGVSGTAWPIGTHEKPSNNLTDALSIMATRDIDRIELRTDLTIGASHDVSGFLIETHGTMGTTVTFESGCAANKTTMRQVSVEGVITNGDVLLIESCSIGTLANFTGIMNVVAFGENAEIGIGNWATIIQATAGGGPTAEPELTIGTAGVNIVQYAGNLKLMGKTGSNRTVVNFSSGNVIIDSTCTAGTIQLLGVGQIEADNSGAGCTVDSDGFLSIDNLSDAVWDESTLDHTDSGSTGKDLETTKKSASNAFAISSAVLSKV